MMKNVIDTNLSEKTLEECLREIRRVCDEAGKPVRIKPTHLIIGEYEIQNYADFHNISFDEAKARIAKAAGL